MFCSHDNLVTRLPGQEKRGGQPGHAGPAQICQLPLTKALSGPFVVEPYPMMTIFFCAIYSWVRW